MTTFFPTPLQLVWSYTIEVWPVEGELEWQMPPLDLAPNIPQSFLFSLYSLVDWTQSSKEPEEA